MRRLAIVPARGGSKRLPGKNIRLLRGKPLINYTVDVVRACFESMIVTSDDVHILAVVEAARNVRKARRPSQLATDHSKVIDTVNYYFDQYGATEFDQIWLCLPTCPLRTDTDLRAGFNLLTDDIDGVVSVTEYEFPPTMALAFDNGLLKSAGGALASGDSRSQDHPRAYRPNGAFYGMWWKSFQRNRNFFRGRVKGYAMPRERSVDVDSEMDFLTADMMLSRRGMTEITALASRDGAP